VRAINVYVHNPAYTKQNGYRCRLIILQSVIDETFCSDGPPAFTPSGIVGHHIPGSDGHPLTAKSGRCGSDTGGSDVSYSSREPTDASSVDSVDASSAEKPRSKRVGHRSLKSKVVAVCLKRKGAAHADGGIPSGKIPEGSRRASAPLEHHPTAGKLHPEAQTPVSERPPPPRPPKPALCIRKSDGDSESATTPTTEDDPRGRLSSCGQLPSTAGAGIGREDAALDVMTPHEVPRTAPVLLDETDGMKLITRMNRKIRSCLRFASQVPDDRRQRLADGGGRGKVHVMDLSSEDVAVTPSILALTYSELLQLGRSSRRVALSPLTNPAFCFCLVA